jgi:hypothetical protein
MACLEKKTLQKTFGHSANADGEDPITDANVLLETS